MSVKADGPITIGLDIGIASVGWAVLVPNRIVDMGVRAFDPAEDKDGKPNNQTRRDARVSRNRYDMRSWRLKKLTRLFRDFGLLTKAEIKHLFSAKHEKNIKHVSPWQLRAEGLTRPLIKQEWAQVIFHIVKHRGFKFFSKSEDPTKSESDDKDTPDSAAKAERDGLRDGLTYTSEILKKYPQFSTLGEAAYQLANARQDKDEIYRDSKGNELNAKDCEEFQNAYRNKGKSYRHAFRRDDLRAELDELFNAQHKHGNLYTELPLPDGVEHLTEIAVSSETRHVEPNFRSQIFALLELQHPPMGIEQMDAMIGDCELESEARNGKGKAERRAAKHTFSNERSTWLQTLNNLRIKRDGKETTLTEQERNILLNLPYTQGKITFKQAREILREQTGFPAHWREASFTKLSYRNKRKDDGSWINIVATDGAKTTLGKYVKPEKVRKEINKKLKQRLETGTMTFAELRQLLNVEEGEVFECRRKNKEIVPIALEDQYPISFDERDAKKAFIKLIPAKSKGARTLTPKAAIALASLHSKPGATLADLRIAIAQTEELERGWQFEKSQDDILPIQPENEDKTEVPIEYEDAQQAEEETLIELKGWHTFKRTLESKQPEWWEKLQAAWQEPLSDAGQSAARQLDGIAEVLTKAQTDADVEKGLAPLQLDDAKLETLEGIRFKLYRNLSLKALRNLLPNLEQGKGYKEACDLAGYQPVTPPPRTRHLPPLETYLYERVRHGRTTGFKKTGYKEQRYKDLTNPVVARAFNQARLVLNALIDRYGRSPAYVHVELARDIAKPLKSTWSNGKKIEGRLDIQKRQEENRNKRQMVRNNFSETHKISDPSEIQILKERLYHEQQCKCVYTLEKLDLDRVVRDENYAQVDHIWPRSRTFDNSMENLALVKAHANQDKGNRIPYEYINSHALFGSTETQRAEHWRKVAAHIIACRGMSDNKQKRLLATELDADEFLARNLVDTRYATRLFARMVRDRLLFDGQTEDRIEDIDPSESGKSRLEKFHKTRVRTPQGGVVSFLRRRWLGDIKDRDAGDKHHAMDACIVAACAPQLIHRVNSWFSNQEKVPNRFKKLDDGRYADKGTGEIISKDEARERGLYLLAPWDEASPGKFRREFFEKYKSVFVARAVRKKRNNELHNANPTAWKRAYRRVRTPLNELTLERLDPKRLPKDFYARNFKLIDPLRTQLEKFDGDAQKAFAEPFLHAHESDNHPTKIVKAIRLPEPIRNGKSNSENSQKDRKQYTEPSAHKAVALTSLTLDKLKAEKLGEQYYRRNQRVIDALVARLNQHNGNAEKAFGDEADPFYKPLNAERNSQKVIPQTHGPRIKSIRLPKNKGSGIHIRGGITELGNSLRTEVYSTEEGYFFRPRYKLAEQKLFGITNPPKNSRRLFSITQDDLIDVTLDDGKQHRGYFVMYEGDGRIQLRDHDQPKKNAHRFGTGKIRHLKKLKVSVLGEISDVSSQE